jgi:hypothetical protein
MVRGVDFLWSLEPSCKPVSVLLNQQPFQPTSPHIPVTFPN